MIWLFDVYRATLEANRVLYELLEERQTNPYLPPQHPFPSWEEQCEFVKNKPYKRWYTCWDDDTTDFVGAVRNDDFQCGVFILQRYWRRGFGFDAMKILLTLYPDDPYMAVIHPENVASIKLHEKLGFKFDLQRPDKQLIYRWDQKWRTL